MNPHANDADRQAFDRWLEVARRSVDAQLESWLTRQVEAATTLGPEVRIAVEALRQLVLRGGKRQRAALVGLSYQACLGDGAPLDQVPPAVAPAMVAFELLQAYLLIHDDWMDGDEVRRGGPSVHAALRDQLGAELIGDAAAVLAGDLACAYAQDALLSTPLGADVVLRAARAFARVQADVVTGQLAEFDRNPLAPRALDRVERTHALKTASYTVTGPVVVGAHLAGAVDATIAHLERFGGAVGVAFQLRDDILGTFGDPRATGKPVGNDVRRAKPTSLVAELCRDARGAALFRRVAGRADASERELGEVLAAMESCGARERVEARIAALLADARRSLDGAGLAPGAARAALAGAISALGERAS